MSPEQKSPLLTLISDKYLFDGLKRFLSATDNGMSLSLQGADAQIAGLPGQECQDRQLCVEYRPSIFRGGIREILLCLAISYASVWRNGPVDHPS